MRRVPFAADEKTSPYVVLDRHRDVVVGTPSTPTSCGS